MKTHEFLPVRDDTGAGRGARRSLALWPLILFTLCSAGRIEAAPLTLTTLVRTNDPAPGVLAPGTVSSVFVFASPGQVPDVQFGPPVAASGGQFAFPGASAHFDANGNQVVGGGIGIWGGVQGGGLAVQFQRRMAAPPLGSNFTQRGLFNLSELGPIAFFAQTTAASGPPDGIWVGSVGGGPLQIAHRLSIPPTTLGLIRPLQTGPYVGYAFQNTNWLYDTVSQQLKAVCWPGMSASVFGPGVTLSGFVGLALTLDGAFLGQANTSDGTNRIFLIKGPDEITPVLARGQPAPGLPGYTIGGMGASGNERGDVAMMTRLVDGDADPFNDRSALFAGPYTNVALLAQSPPGVIWGGGTFITRANHVLGVGATGQGIYKLAASTNESTTFTPLPPFPHPPLPVTIVVAASLNALGQYVVLYGSANQQVLNPGTDLWLFNPGDGWTNLARRGSNIVASGETIRVNDIGFQGNIGGGAGHATGLADDGALVFCVNGTHLVTTAVTPCPGVADALAFQAAAGAFEFYYTGLLGPNWHATIGDCPPKTNWKDANGVGQPFSPGDVLSGTAAAIINAFAGETINLDLRPANIGSLRANRGLLRLREHLTLNQASGLYDLRMEAPRGALTVNTSDTIISNNFEWVTGTVDGTGQFGPGAVLTTNLFLTNGTTVRLHAALLAQKRAEFNNGTTLILSNGVLRNRGEFRAGTGTITKGGGSPPVQNFGVLRKQGAGDFTIDTPYHGFEALLRQPPWGIRVEEGRLRLLDGGRFLGFHTNEIELDSELELAGPFTFQGEYTAFRGDGTLRLGLPNDSVELRVSLSTKVEFGLGGNSAHFISGVITGSGSVTNGGAFFWEGGVIGRPDGIFRPSFQNGGDFFIEDAPAPLRLEGPLVNSRNVLQFGDLEMTGRIENKAGWLITQADVRVSGPSSASFVNNGGNENSSYVADPREGFYVAPNLGGTAEFDVEFSNNGLVDVNPLEAPNTVLRLQQPKSVSSGALSEGVWRVHRNGTLDTPNHPVGSVRGAVVQLRGGQWPQFQPTRIDTVANSPLEADVSFADGNYTLPGPLRIVSSSIDGRGAALNIGPGGSLVVNGLVEVDLLGQVVVAGEETQFASLRVNGTFAVEQLLIVGKQGLVEATTFQGSPTAAIVIDGHVTAAPFRQGGALISGSGRINGMLINDALLAPGKSPGTFTVNGHVIQTNTSVLAIEIAGAATNQYDQILVSSNAALAGTLALNLIDDYRPGPGVTFTVVRAGALTGQFANATNGQRLATIDGYGSFIVNYTPTSVVLSAFQANLNPPTTAPGRLLTPTFAFGNMELTLTGSPGRDYILQSSTNLFDWLSLLTNNAGFDGQLRFELPAAGGPYQFFRALAP